MEGVLRVWHAPMSVSLTALESRALKRSLGQDIQSLQNMTGQQEIHAHCKPSSCRETLSSPQSARSTSARRP
eukprot:6466168-Amphidinium_carterae.3